MGKVVQVELPEKVAEELEALVAGGWFATKEEIVRLALAEFIGRHRFALLERFQREDIAWALQQKQDQTGS